MNTQEQNWKKLFGNHTLEGIAWHGIWTVYSPEKEIIKSFQGVRSFRVNEEQTAIIHTNNYTYPDGSTAEQTWQLEKQSCNQRDGVIHPAILSMRALSFGQGATAWVSKTLETGKKFGVELFFRYKDWRTSVASIYGENGDLEKITLIREHLGSSPKTAGPEIEHFFLLGKWLGTKEDMNPDLKVSPAEETQALVLDPTGGKNETFFLPDGVVANTPKRIKVGEEFEIVAGKLVSTDEYKRLTCKYDKSGAFALLISEVFRR
jgi:hypothetical protein